MAKEIDSQTRGNQDLGSNANQQKSKGGHRFDSRGGWTFDSPPPSPSPKV